MSTAMASNDSSGAILLVEDDAEVRTAVRDLLSLEGHVVAEAATAVAAQDMLRRHDVDLVLLDLGLPDMDGLDLLSLLRQVDDRVVVVVLTGRGDIETVVEAMKRGAENFLVKPVQGDSLRAAVNRAVSQCRLRRQQLTMVAERQRRGIPEPVGSSKGMRRVRELADKVAATDASVVLLGESGTGKGMLAQLIHHLSRRIQGPFMDVNCAALPPQLLESELFGHERGAFTDARDRKLGLLEAAHGGSLFLDEVAELDLLVQSKLLKALEDRRFRRLGGVREIAVDVRIIVATHRDLGREVAAGRFRQDLYYRLNVFAIEIPPLRERQDDILEIALHFVADLNPVLGRRVRTIRDEAVRMLQHYSWPGNVRELRNVIERAMILATGDEITSSHLSADLQRGGEPATAPALQSLASIEAEHIRRVLAATAGNLKRAAEVLGIARSTLYSKLQEHGITVQR
jgi:two-component system, NtrC family, response regulator AtoC